MALTQKEISRRFYESRKNSGLCPACGKELDREGHYCSECLKIHNEYNRETKILCRNNGICPVCRKEKLFGDEKQCILCREKAFERKKPLTDEQKKRYAETFKKSQRELYKERSENGICTRCGKIKAERGKKKCAVCLEKDAIRHRLKTDVTHSREYRKEHNLCYRCGGIRKEGYLLCEKCYYNFTTMVKTDNYYENLRRIKEMNNFYFPPKKQ